MRVLNVVPTVDPAAGGPAECVRQYGLHANANGQCVEVLTLDAPSSEFVRDYPLPIHAIGPSRGHFGYNASLVGWLRAHAKDYDCIIVNGLWQYHAFGTWRALRGLGVPYCVFTHGMLDPWFKKAYPLKHLKKWLYWPWAEYRVLRDASAVLFTCEEERRLAPQSFWLYKAREQVVNFGTRTPPQQSQDLREVFLRAYPSLRGQRLVLFLGRIQEKKGCDLLIEAFASAAQRDPDLHLLMAGPDQEGWGPQLRELAERLGVAPRISWPGMLQGDVKWGAFHASEVFALTSHQENFGIAVAEALACGLPVLISDKVNIWREIAADGAGFVEPDDAAGSRRLLERWMDLTSAERAAMREQARQTFAQRFTIDAMVRSLTDVLSRVSVAGRGR